MKAGAAVSSLIFPEDFFPTEGFGEMIDSLHARVLVLEDSARYALLVLELTSLPPEEIEALSQILRERTQADSCHILVTHTFSAPHFLPDHALAEESQRRKKGQLRALVYRAVEEAAQEAVEHLAACSLRMGTAQCQVATPRDVLTPDGWWVGSCGPGQADERMTILRMEAPGGRPIATLVHYPIQSSVLDGSCFGPQGKPVSGDLAGRMAAGLEQEWESPVLFLIGAAGDQAPRTKARQEWFENGLRTEQDLGRLVMPELNAQAGEMMQAARNALSQAAAVEHPQVTYRESRVLLPGKLINRNLRQLHPTKLPPYEPDAASEQTISLLQIGQLKLLGVKPEVNGVTARQIAGGDDNVRVVTLWNGGAKYLADQQSCDRITYQAQNSPFYPGAAEKLVQSAQELLKQG